MKNFKYIASIFKQSEIRIFIIFDFVVFTIIDCD